MYLPLITNSFHKQFPQSLLENTRLALRDVYKCSLELLFFGFVHSVVLKELFHGSRCGFVLNERIL